MSFLIGQNKNLLKIYRKRRTKFTKMCGLSSPKVLYPILRRLEQLGFIRVCRNSNLEILFNIDASNSPTVIEVNDFDNIYAYYHNYLGKGRYVECSSCGKMVRVKGKWRKYCNECAREINIQKTIERKKVWSLAQFLPLFLTYLSYVILDTPK